MTAVATSRSLSVLPVLSSRDLVPARVASLHGVLDVGRPIALNSGTAAILVALQAAKIGTGSSVLLPAFHCPAMVDAVVASGARPVFYRINEDLAIHETHIAAGLQSDTRAAIVPHLFTRVQRMQPIKNLCDERGMVLIEDCAHALFGAVEGVPIGSTGHFAIASPRKFLPLVEGGLLTSASVAAVEKSIAAPSMLHCARALFDGIDIATRHGHLRACAPFVLGAKAFGRRRETHSAVPSSSASARVHVNAVRACGLTRFMMRWSLSARAMHRRVRNYSYLIEGIARIPGARVLDASADNVCGTVPYMVPLILDRPARQFADLKGTGVPMWRWEYSAVEHCETARWYAQSLVQLPCHQSLSLADLDWMLERVAAVFAASAGTRMSTNVKHRPADRSLPERNVGATK